MSQLSIKYNSQALNRSVRFEMYIPNDRPQEAPQKLRTLFLLHGYTGDAGNWVPEWLMQKYGFAVVAPSGENGFWLDGISTGRKYCTFVGTELVDYIRRTFGLAASTVPATATTPTAPNASAVRMIVPTLPGSRP